MGSNPTSGTKNPRHLNGGGDSLFISVSDYSAAWKATVQPFAAAALIAEALISP